MAKKKKASQVASAAVKPESSPDSDSLLAGYVNVLSLREPPALAKAKKQQKDAKLVEKWNDYFQKGTLEDHQRLCRDLGLDDTLPSKTKCVKALKSVNVNIVQFLNSVNRPEDVIMFRSYHALRSYTTKGRKFPRKQIPQGSPLRTLLKVMF